MHALHVIRSAFRGPSLLIFLLAFNPDNALTSRVSVFDDLIRVAFAANDFHYRRVHFSRARARPFTESLFFEREEATQVGMFRR